MILGETVLGTVGDPSWAPKLERAAIDVLALDQWQAQKNRFRLRSGGGAEVAVALDRDAHLRDGDILAWDESTSTAIVARIDLQDVLVIELDGLPAGSDGEPARTCFELGHALGNQHWPAVMKGATIYVPLTVDRRVMASVMKTHGFAGIRYECRPGTDVIPYLAPHEARRLFGGANATPHTHTPRPEGHAHDHP